MRKILIQILSTVLLSLICACHAQVSERDCTLAVNTVGELYNLADYSYESALEYQYQIKASGIEASESEWVSFTYPKVDISDLSPGKYEFYVRAVKNGVTYSQGHSSVTVSQSGSNDYTVVMYRNSKVSGKGVLCIKESSSCRDFSVELTYDGPQYKTVSGRGASEYSQELSNGFYIVSVVYKNGDNVVGGRTFSVYVEAYSTVTVNIETVVNVIPRKIKLEFFNLTAPHITGKACTGYKLNGVPVSFPHTFDVVCYGEPTYKDLGLEPIYTSLSDTNAILKSTNVEVWSSDLPDRGYFMGKSCLDVQTPKMIVVHGNPPREAFSLLRDLETAVVKDAKKIYTEGFYYNKKLKNVYLCKSITMCEMSAFKSCDVLSDFYLEAPNRDNIEFDCDMDLSKYNFHYNCKF